MKNLIRLEEAAMFGLAIYGLSLCNVAWWWYLLLLLGPDISMLGYLAGTKTGAACYNLCHHKGIAVLLFVAGLAMPGILLQTIGMVVFGHSAMDRLFGYGLKFEQGFRFTHLGIIGKKQ